MTSPRNSVGKVDGMEILLARERVESPDAARLAHAGLRGGSEQRGVSEGRHVPAEQFGEEVDVFVQQALRGRRLAVVGHIGLRAVHLNDSMNPCGAHKDRHQKLGQGCIGLEALIRVVNHPALKNLPFILETPNEDEGYAAEIALMREHAQ